MSLLSLHRAPLRPRYQIRWRRMSEALAMAAATALWIGFLIHGA